ncbi:MAG: agmatine deiminase family protein [Saprospiraceae bacterium]|nr:agmatine deiminase family protein [Saprospiraceae bacterium]
MQDESPCRLPAEWETQSAIQFTWPNENMDWGQDAIAVQERIHECIALITEDQSVIVAGQNVDSIRQELSDIPSERLHIVEVTSNDVWARDNGPITVQYQGKLVLLDFQFNGWGKKYPAELDNQVTKHLYQSGLFGQIERRELSLVLEGGAIESDGMGTLIGSTDCLLDKNRNPHADWNEMLAQLKNQLGVSRVLTLPSGQLAGDDTDGHIDTIARFCTTSTIAYVQCNDPKDEHLEFLQSVERELKQWRTLAGQAYNLLPLPLPDPCFHPEDGHRLPATYANFIISNRYVIVPTYQQEKDRLAIDRLAQVFSNRQVVGVDALPIIKQHGSLHCLCMQFPEGVINR